MKIKNLKLYPLFLLLLFQSCFWGAGIVEKEITDDYWLFANSHLEEMMIFKDNKLIVKETVFAVGHNRDFIVALSHPRIGNRKVNKGITFYSIIDLDKSPEFNIEHNVNLDYENFRIKSQELSINNDIEYTIFFENIE